MAGTNPAVANKTGNIYKSLIDGTTNIIEDTADAWDEQVIAGATNSVTTSDGPTSTDRGAPAKGVTLGQTVALSIAGGSIVCSEAIASTDLSGQDSILIRFKTSVAIPAGDLLFEMGASANLATPLESIAFPAITGDDVGVWVTRNLKLSNPSLDTAIISIGFKFKAATTINMTFQYYQVIQMQEIQGMKNFTAPVTTEMLDSTDYQSGEYREKLTSYTDSTMDFGGNKEGAPAVKVGLKYWFVAQEAETPGQDWISQGYRSTATPTGTFDGLVEYAFSVGCTGYMQEPVA